jgi:hypothetical protein
MTRAEILDGGVSDERHAGQHDGDDPDLPRIDPAERAHRIVGYDRQHDERHRQQHQSGAQLRPSDPLHPAMQVFTHGQEAGGRDARRCRHPQVPDRRIGAERERHHAGNRSRRGETFGLSIFVAEKYRHGSGIGSETEAEQETGRVAGLPCQRAEHAAQQAGDGKRADSGGATARTSLARPPAPLQADQQADAERHAQASKKVLSVHGHPTDGRTLAHVPSINLRGG